MTRNLLYGTMLSYLAYWHRPTPGSSQSRLKIFRDSHLWVAISVTKWQQQFGLTRRQVDTARRALTHWSLIETATYRYRSQPTTHYRLRWPEFLAAYNEYIRSGTAALSPLPRAVLTTAYKTARDASKTPQPSLFPAPCHPVQQNSRYAAITPPNCTELYKPELYARVQHDLHSVVHSDLTAAYNPSEVPKGLKETSYSEVQSAVAAYDCIAGTR